MIALLTIALASPPALGGDPLAGAVRMTHDLHPEQAVVACDISDHIAAVQHLTRRAAYLRDAATGEAPPIASQTVEAGHFIAAVPPGSTAARLTFFQTVTLELEWSPAEAGARSPRCDVVDAFEHVVLEGRTVGTSWPHGWVHGCRSKGQVHPDGRFSAELATPERCTLKLVGRDGDLTRSGPEVTIDPSAPPPADTVTLTWPTRADD